MKKYLKYIAIVIIICLGGFGFYVYKLHALAVEGNRIFEYRCTNVNTPLIAYKNAFLKFADYINNPKKYTNEQVRQFLHDYLIQMEAYIYEETKWLEMDKIFITRWDYRLLEPWYIQKAGEYQWKMYEGYRDDAKQILSMTWKEDPMSGMSPGYVSEERQRRDKYTELYFTFFKEAQQINDWRKFFGRVPIPKGCTEKNVVIPNTSGAIDWNEASPSSTPVEISPNSLNETI